jgi:hypothetical protein
MAKLGRSAELRTREGDPADVPQALPNCNSQLDSCAGICVTMSAQFAPSGGLRFHGPGGGFERVARDKLTRPPLLAASTIFAMPRFQHRGGQTCRIILVRQPPREADVSLKFSSKRRCAQSRPSARICARRAHSALEEQDRSGTDHVLARCLALRGSPVMNPTSRVISPTPCD